MNSRIAGRTAALASMLFVVGALGGWSIVQARPVVIEESATITTPDPSWEYFGRSVAIDDDWALVQGDRFIPDPEAENGLRHDGAALLFRRVNSVWTYAGILGTIDAVDEWTSPGLAMKGGVAMVIEKSVRVFERTGDVWTQSALPDEWRRLQGPDIEIDSGRILVPRIACRWDSAVYRKAGTAWSVEGLLDGHTNECGDNPPTAQQDLEGGRAVVFNTLGLNNEPPVARLYRPSAAGGWEQFVEFLAPPSATRYGADAALHGPYVAVTGSAESGTYVWRETNGSWGTIAPLRPVDSYMQPGPNSTTRIEHGGQYFFQRNFSYDRNAHVVNVFLVSGTEVEHVAMLVAKEGASLGRSIDISGNRVIVSGRDYFEGENTAHVFELPTNLVAGEVGQDDFEQSGAGADWQPIAGSAFSVVQSGNTRVYRQRAVAGNAASFLPASESMDQSVQAEVTPREFSGSDPVTPNTWYTLRLERIGGTLRVFVNDTLRISAGNVGPAAGQVGLVTYKAAAEFDDFLTYQP